MSNTNEKINYSYIENKNIFDGFLSTINEHYELYENKDEAGNVISSGKKSPQIKPIRKADGTLSSRPYRNKFVRRDKDGNPLLDANGNKIEFSKHSVGIKVNFGFKEKDNSWTNINFIISVGVDEDKLASVSDDDLIKQARAIAARVLKEKDFSKLVYKNNAGVEDFSVTGSEFTNENGRTNVEYTFFIDHNKFQPKTQSFAKPTKKVTVAANSKRSLH